jgi:hypothetical protein
MPITLKKTKSKTSAFADEFDPKVRGVLGHATSKASETPTKTALTLNTTLKRCILPSEPENEEANEDKGHQLVNGLDPICSRRSPIPRTRRSGQKSSHEEDVSDVEDPSAFDEVENQSSGGVEDEGRGGAGLEAKGKMVQPRKKACAILVFLLLSVLRLITVLSQLVAEVPIDDIAYQDPDFVTPDKLAKTQSMSQKPRARRTKPADPTKSLAYEDMPLWAQEIWDVLTATITRHIAGSDDPWVLDHSDTQDPSSSFSFLGLVIAIITVVAPGREGEVRALEKQHIVYKRVRLIFNFESNMLLISDMSIGSCSCSLVA